jgi:hypothetical protein
MNAVILDSTLTCPKCGQVKTERMRTDRRFAPLARVREEGGKIAAMTDNDGNDRSETTAEDVLPYRREIEALVQASRRLLLEVTAAVGPNAFSLAELEVGDLDPLQHARRALRTNRAVGWDHYLSAGNYQPRGDSLAGPWLLGACGNRCGTVGPRILTTSVSQGGFLWELVPRGSAVA